MSGARWNQISVKNFHATILGRFAQICRNGVFSNWQDEKRSSHKPVCRFWSWFLIKQLCMHISSWSTLFLNNNACIFQAVLLYSGWPNYINAALSSRNIKLPMIVPKGN